MNIKHSIGLNLSADAIPHCLHMVQGDANSRTIVATLWDGAQPYSIPSGAAIMVRFRKPDGTGGLYDTTESGNKVSYTGSIVTAPVATQMLAVAGDVFAEIDIFGNSSGEAAERLATFHFVVKVMPCVLPGADVISSDYYNILTVKVGEAVAAANQAKQAQSAAASSAAAAATSAANAATSVEGAVKYNTPQTLTEEQQQQARDNIGAPTPYTAGENISISGSVIATKVFPCSPNLLGNWYFGIPVNQRGKTSYAGTGYGVDMWYTTGATLSVDVTAEGIKLYKTAASANPAWAQALETDAAVGQTVTVSMLYKGSGEGASLRVAQSGGIVTLSNVSDWTLVQKTFALEKWSVGTLQDRAIVAIQCFENMEANQGLYIKAIKLELGEQQTLAHQENGAWVLNEIPSYADQLSRCQRYLIPLSSYLCPASRLGSGAILFFLPLPATMRTLPTIEQNGFQVLSKTGEAQTGFTFSVSSLRSNSVIINASKTGHGMTDAVLSAGTLSLLSAEL